MSPPEQPALAVRRLVAVLTAAFSPNLAMKTEEVT
jgi:hypothetical protein